MDIHSRLRRRTSISQLSPDINSNQFTTFHMCLDGCAHRFRDSGHISWIPFVEQRQQTRVIRQYRFIPLLKLSWPMAADVHCELGVMSKFFDDLRQREVDFFLEPRQI